MSVSLLIAAEEEKFSFTGYKLIRLFPQNQQQVKFIHELEEIDNDVFNISILILNHFKVVT